MKNNDFILNDIQLALLLRREQLERDQLEKSKKQKSKSKLVQEHAQKLLADPSVEVLVQDQTLKDNDQQSEELINSALLAGSVEHISDKLGYVQGLIHMSEGLLALPSIVWSKDKQGTTIDTMGVEWLERCEQLAKKMHIQDGWRSDFLRAALINDDVTLSMFLIDSNYSLSHESGGFFVKRTPKGQSYEWEAKVSNSVVPASDLSQYEDYGYSMGRYDWSQKSSQKLADIWKQRAPSLAQTSMYSERDAIYARLSDWGSKYHVSGSVVPLLIKNKSKKTFLKLLSNEKSKQWIDRYANPLEPLYEHLGEQLQLQEPSMNKDEKTIKKTLATWQKKLPLDYESIVLGAIRAHDPVCLVLESNYGTNKSHSTLTERQWWLNALEKVLPKTYFHALDGIIQQAWIQSALSMTHTEGLECGVWDFLNKYKVYEAIALPSGFSEMLIDYLLEDGALSKKDRKKTANFLKAQQQLLEYIEQGKMVEKWSNRGSDLNKKLLKHLTEPFERAKVMQTIDVDEVRRWLGPTSKGSEQLKRLLMRPKDAQLGLDEGQLKKLYEKIQEALLHCSVSQPEGKRGYGLEVLTVQERELVQCFADVCAQLLGQKIDSKPTLRL